MPFTKCAPTMCLLTNFDKSGLGTMFSASTCRNKEKSFSITLLIGYTQCVDGIIGYIWSLVYS